jgi:hypothetical protein
VAKFRKKPVEIEAVQWTGVVTPELEALFGTRELTIKTSGSPLLQVRTLEGVMTANVGDWIIQGTRGELYPCKPEVFADVYEEARSYREGMKFVPVSAIHLYNTVRGQTVVAVELADGWHRAIVESSDGTTSHIVEARGIEASPLGGVL